MKNDLAALMSAFMHQFVLLLKIKSKIDISGLEKIISIEPDTYGSLLVLVTNEK